MQLRFVAGTFHTAQGNNRAELRFGSVPSGLALASDSGQRVGDRLLAHLQRLEASAVAGVIDSSDCYAPGHAETPPHVAQGVVEFLKAVSLDKSSTR
jgi:hypothetical protein